MVRFFFRTSNDCRFVFKGAFIRFVKLAEKNPDLKCILGIGGWNEGSQKYSAMANDPGRRANFVKTAVAFLKKYGFHGLDVDWEYPTQRGGQYTDKDAYTALLQVNDVSWWN